MSEKQVDITGRLQKIGETVAGYKDSLQAHFKDMDVEIKDWNFSVGKSEQEYNVDVTVKLRIKPKAKAETKQQLGLSTFRELTVRKSACVLLNRLELIDEIMRSIDIEIEEMAQKIASLIENGC